MPAYSPMYIFLLNMFSNKYSNNHEWFNTTDTTSYIFVSIHYTDYILHLVFSDAWQNTSNWPEIMMSIFINSCFCWLIVVFSSRNKLTRNGQWSSILVFFIQFVDNYRISKIEKYFTSVQTIVKRQITELRHKLIIFRQLKSYLFFLYYWP